MIPLHQFMHNVGEVLIVKCCDSEGRGYGLKADTWYALANDTGEFVEVQA